MILYEHHRNIHLDRCIFKTFYKSSPYYGGKGEEKSMINMEVLRQKADAKGLNFSALERRADLGNGVIARWATSSPSLTSVQKVAAVLECNIDDLIIKVIKEAV